MNYRLQEGVILTLFQVGQVSTEVIEGAVRPVVFIENLHFVGAHTHRGDGYSSAYISGLDAGKAILRADRQKGGMER